MRITPDLTIAGYPGIRVRQLFRRVFRYDSWTDEDVAEEMGISKRKAAALVAALVAEGYLETADAWHKSMAKWEPSRKGASLTMASAAKPIRRATADRLVKGLVERAGMLMDPTRHEYAFVVTELIVFGSYLTDRPDLGDVDFAVRWQTRFEDKDQQYACRKARVRAAKAAGKRFHWWFLETEWPEVEVQRFLKGPSQYVSLHDAEKHREFLASIPHQRLLP
jgi:hypothetical protein